MLIAVSSKGDTLEAPMDSHFGRASYFILYDTDQDTFQTLDNRANQEIYEGAGTKAAQTLFRYNVQALVTPSCGVQAFYALKSAGIAVYLHRASTVQEAVQEFKNRRLVKSSGPGKVSADESCQGISCVYQEHQGG